MKLHSIFSHTAAALALSALLLSGCGSSRYHNPDLTAAFAAQETTQEATQGTTQEAAQGTAQGAAQGAAQETSHGPGANIPAVLETSPEADSPANPEASSGPDSPGPEIPAEAEPQPVRLLFSGDIYLSDHVLNAYDRAGDISGVLDDGYRSLIGESDYFAANQEFPFSSRGQQAPDKQYTFRLPESRVSLMNEIGVDLVTLANNHALDFGTDALLDTVSTLDQAGILHVGAGADSEAARQPAIVDVNGVRVGFIGASRVIPVASWTAGDSSPGMLTAYDPALLVQTIQETRPLCDYLVVLIHWGVERAEMPVDHQTSLGRQCIDAGADLVVGSHPHVLQGIEYYRGKPIVYSLGNFIFGSSIPRTALLEVSLTPQETSSDASQDSPQDASRDANVSPDTSLTLHPGTSSGGFTRMVTEPAKKEEFFQYLEGISFDISIDESGAVTPPSDTQEDLQK